MEAECKLCHTRHIMNRRVPTNYLPSDGIGAADNGWLSDGWVLYQGTLYFKRSDAIARRAMKCSAGYFVDISGHFNWNLPTQRRWWHRQLSPWTICIRPRPCSLCLQWYRSSHGLWKRFSLDHPVEQATVKYSTYREALSLEMSFSSLDATHSIFHCLFSTSGT